MELKDVVALLAAPFGLGAGAVVAVIALQWVLKRIAAGGDAYARKKGENLATKEDLVEAVRQLKRFEETRAAVAHDDWIAREWKAARIRNLETFEAGLQQSYEDAQTAVHATLTGSQEDLTHLGTGVSIRLRTLQKLYYPELGASLEAFQLAVEALPGMAIACYFWSRQKPENEQLIAKEFDALGQKQQELEAAREQCSEALAGVARDLFNVTAGFKG
ncbi:hypothetical protein SAMN04487939_101895 [Lysobacter sp. yr284]|uniref:hypothetical protein n=1 Tax=Lysobacter sp. yr284 TaxID=1761791 RepID=UPI0008977D5B|nr:hypothetical protein [Lysobacter sp. yr284]SDY33597.1 hypothetical protein SAMN04487939_101895 [Lysobacter sp. yr284]